MGIPRKVSDLGYLSLAERQVLRELDTGEPIILGNGVPAKGDEPRKVRAGLIRLLLLGDDPNPKYRLHENGVQIAGAWIIGVLDLEGCRDLRDLGLFACWFDLTPMLRSAGVSNLYLNGSRLPGLCAERLVVGGGVFLRGIEAIGEVNLLGAQFGGELNCRGATFRAEKDAQGNPGHALSADGLEARGAVFLCGVRATGEVRLPGAKLGVQLDCGGATFHAEKDARGNPGKALCADGLVAGGGVNLSGIIATGEVRLPGAKLGGSLDCTGATFRAEKDAQGKPGSALFADSLAVADSVVLSGVTATGEVRLLGAKLGGDLSCPGAIFRGEKDAQGNSGYALSAHRLEAKGGAFLDGVTLAGPGMIPGVKIAGDLDFRGAHDGDGSGIALDLRGSRIGGVLHMPTADKCGGALVLSGAHARVLDGGAKALATPERVWLNRFEYDGLVGDAVNVPVDDWLAFLAKQFRPGDPADFYPQPYEQLAGVLRKAGHGEEARAILIEKEKRQRAARRARADGVAKVWFGFWDWLLGVTVRYGRQPLRAFYWLLCFWLVGVAVFGVAEAKGALKPNKEVVLRSEEWVGCAEEGPEAQAGCYLLTERGKSYPRFNRWIYSADTLLPIVSLEMQEYWIPDEGKDWPGQGARGYLWFHIAVGWALSLLAVAGFSGLVKSD